MATISQAAADLDALADELEAGRIVTEADRLFGGQFIRSRILDRTARGVDAKGEKFADYSLAYWKRKADAGGRTDMVDLYGVEHHPHMLNAMMARSTPRGFEVGFYGEEAVRAQANNEGTEHIPARRFFQPSEEDLTDVHQAIGTRVTTRLLRSTSLSNLGAALEE